MTALRTIMLQILLSCALGISFFAGHAEAKSDVWEFLVNNLPETVSVRNAEDAVTYYILRQTHEPLFRREDGQNYRSRLLKSWSRDLGNRNYRFCPDTSLEFSAERPFSEDYFREYITEVTGRYSGDFSVESAPGCVLVRFRSARAGYLNFLSNYENSPSLSLEAGVDSGLGPFRLVSRDAASIVLARKKRVSSGYNQVKLRVYSGAKDPLLQNRGISDFNRVPQDLQPAWLRSSYNGFNNLEPIAVTLLINHPDRAVRDLVYNCADVAELRRALVPGLSRHYDISTVLPIGVPGGRGGLAKQTCRPSGRAAKTRLILANYADNNQAELSKFADKFSRETGLSLEVRNFAPAEMMKELNKKTGRRAYNLVRIVTGTLKANPASFFAFYLGEDRFVDHVPAELLAEYARLQQTDSEDEKARISASLAEGLVKARLALPLYQIDHTLYYPRDLKNLNVGRGFFEYPEVADFKW